MIVEVEGLVDDKSKEGEYLQASPERSRPVLEHVRSWDANKIISRPIIYDLSDTPEYFDNPKGYTRKSAELEQGNPWAHEPSLDSNLMQIQEAGATSSAVPTSNKFESLTTGTVG
jgi:hypothetical protein